MPISRPKKQSGFSLIELVTVLLIITVLSTIAIRSTVDIGYSARYEQTKERLEGIREAIVGNPKRSINGQPDISGFVADMGRLPINLRELISSDDFCLDSDYVSDVSDDLTYGTLAQCNAAGFLWHTVTPANTPQLSEGYLKSGWRGPYIQAGEIPSSTTSDIYLDGWANQINTETAFEHFFDYGWYWCHWDNADDIANSGTANNLPDDLATVNGFPNCNVISIAELEHLSIFSLGKNGVGDVSADGSVNCGENEYDDDCYSTILEEDYLVDISAGISITLHTEYDTHPYCGFLSSVTYSTQLACENAGGAWSGTCVLNVSNCKSVGGLWKSCMFSASDCIQSGGTHTRVCKFTQNSCTAISGVWATPNCTLSSATYCSSAGGAWTGTECIFNEQQCANAGGSSITQCDFNSSTCASASGVWEATSPASCTFTQTNCQTINGHSTASDCYMSHAENTGALYSGASCDIQNGQWVNRICMRMFYRNSITSAITSIASNPITVNEAGIFQSFLFNFTSPPDIPIGINSVAVYEYDGDCDATNSFYPSDRTQPIQVILNARTSLPIINW